MTTGRTWDGPDRRIGTDRRIGVMERPEIERRVGERRGTGMRRVGSDAWPDGRQGESRAEPEAYRSPLAGYPTRAEAATTSAPAAVVGTPDTEGGASDRPDLETTSPADRAQGPDAGGGAARGGSVSTEGANEESRHEAAATDAVPSVAAVAGHPLHPAVVPLPIGAFAGALAADLAFAATGDRFFARGARLLTAAGVTTGAVAGALGAADFLGRRRIRSYPAAWIHAGGNAAVVVAGALSLFLRLRAADPRHAVVPAGLALSLAAGTTLLVTGWLGGELTYRYRIGVTGDGTAPVTSTD